MKIGSATWVKLLDHVEAAALWFAGWVLPVVFVLVVWFGLLGPLTAGVLEAGGHSREGRQLLVQLLGGSVAFVWVMVRLYRYHRHREVAAWPAATAIAVPQQRGFARLAPGGADSPEVHAELERRARHEAAHAVAGTWAGNQILALDVLDGPGRGGRCNSTPIEGSIPDSAFGLMCLAVAGNLVDVETGHYDAGAEDDMQVLLRAAAAVISTGKAPTGYRSILTSDALISTARGVAQGALARFPHVVEDLVAALMANPARVLAGEQLEQLLEPVTSMRPAQLGAVWANA